MWINPDQIVQLTPLIDGAPDARRLINEVKLVGLPILRSYFGTFISAHELDARWHRLLSELEPPSAGPNPPAPAGETP